MIYKLPAIAWSSVTVRITGAMASFGFFGVAGATLYGGAPWMADNLHNIVETAPTAAKFAVAYVISYQWFGSARHMYWDLTAKGFENKMMLQGAYAMFGVTTVLSLALAMYSLPPSTNKKSQAD